MRFACIINDKHRAAGRGGAGAVMGAKKLKAIFVTGSKTINITEPEKFKNLTKKILEKIDNTTVTNVNLRQYGTAKIMDAVNDYRLLGTRNFQQNYFEHVHRINAEQLKKNLLVRRKACYNCTIACKRVTRVGDKTGEGPEFETLWSFGANCGINDINTIARANYLCNELGLDTISTGNTIGCAMEMAEKRLINETLSFGEAQMLEDVIKNIAFRRDQGDRLAEGSYRFTELSGHTEFSMSVKKQELPAYDPRCAQAQGLGYITSNRGACHVRAFVVKSDMVAGPQKVDEETIATKTKSVIDSQNRTAVIDSLGMCLFSSFVCTPEDYLDFLEAGTAIGIEDADELLHVGERIWNLERAFNVRAGFGREDDALPERFKQETVTDSLGHEHTFPETELLTEYYRQRNWTVGGVPSREKMDELGI